jgi:hypothetical protein
VAKPVVQNQDARAAQNRQQARFHRFDELPGSQAARAAQVGFVRPRRAESRTRSSVGHAPGRAWGRAAASSGQESAADKSRSRRRRKARSDPRVRARAAWRAPCARQPPGATRAACRCAGGCAASASAPGAMPSLACRSRRNQAPPFCQRATHAGGLLARGGKHLGCQGGVHLGRAARASALLQSGCAALLPTIQGAGDRVAVDWRARRRSGRACKLWLILPRKRGLDFRGFSLGWLRVQPIVSSNARGDLQPMPPCRRLRL